MKARPILFSTPMIQAILDGRKTQTRRTKVLDQLNRESSVWRYINDSTKIDIPRPAKKYDDATYHLFNPINSNAIQWVIASPFGKKCDILWVKETFYAYGHWTKITDTETLKTEWRFCDLTIDQGKEYLYETNKPDVILKRKTGGLGYYKRPSIFMSKQASRLFLEVSDVKVERLNDISELDCVSEGALYKNDSVSYDGENYNGSFKNGFQSLWESINGSGSWDKNPWVWAIKFKEIEKPSNF